MNKKLYDLMSENISLLFQKFAYDNIIEFRKLFLTSSFNEKNLISKKLKIKYTKYLRKDKINSYDQVYMLYDQYYSMYKLNKYSNMNEFCNFQLSNITKTFIAHRDGKFVLKYWKTSNSNLIDGLENLEKIELWNSFSRFQTSDLLVATYLLDNGMKDIIHLKNFNWIISIGDSQLDKILSKGVSENHIHINAGYNFGVLWNALLNDIENKTKNKLNKQINGVVFNKLKMAILIRYILDYSLRNSDNLSVQELLNGKENLIKKISILSLISNFITGDTYNIEHYKSVLESFWDIFVNSSRDKSKRLYIEKEFVFLGLNKTRIGNDNLFNDLFWQYIRIKNEVYVEVTQNNDEEGLDFFRNEKYSKVVNVFENDVENLYSNIVTQIKSNVLKKIEIRVAPGKSKKDIIKKLKVFFKVYLKILEDNKNVKSRLPIIGIVFHLIKTEENVPLEKCFFKETENNDLIFKNENLFYGNIIKEYKNTADIIREIRNKYNKMSYYIVGIDTASGENLTEPWVFAPVYQNLRDSKNSTVVNGGNLNSYDVKTLGFTYHVGEEYRHIVSGLRHIYEVVEYLGYHAGDRIGHGISLGIDASKWIESNSVVFMPRIEHLENLIWIWGTNSNYYSVTNLVDDISLERKILECAKKIYGNASGITLQVLWEAYQDKFSKFEPDIQEINEFCSIEKNSENNCVFRENYNSVSWNSNKIIYANHCKCYLEKMYEIIQVKVYKEECLAIAELQKKMRKKINDKGVIIETNPTSNLSISGMERLYSHPIITLNRTGLVDKSTKDTSLMISINSDDPSIFNSTVSNEIGYIFYTLQYQGYSRETILSWIDKIREWGLESSFVDNRELTINERIKEIKEIISDLNMM